MADENVLDLGAIAPSRTKITFDGEMIGSSPSARTSGCFEYQRMARLAEEMDKIIANARPSQAQSKVSRAHRRRDRREADRRGQPRDAPADLGDGEGRRDQPFFRVREGEAARADRGGRGVAAGELIARLQRFYGGDPERWLDLAVRDPARLHDDAATAGGGGTPGGGQHDRCRHRFREEVRSDRFMRELERAAKGGEKATRVETIDDLRQLGPLVKLTPKRKAD
ncbi:MAG: hypothetical protein M5T61_21405 [Acidimicrobiia bacterium]|nr:hypothetical protein [Acidimicrobiia bacterium]